MNTHELKVMTFNEAMAGLDKKEWEASVQHEHDWMVKNKVWDVVDMHSIPKGADIIDSMWVMKKKANAGHQTTSLDTQKPLVYVSLIVVSCSNSIWQLHWHA